MAARKGQKPRRGKGRLAKVLQFLFVAALIAAMTVGATIFFQVEDVTVEGNARYSPEELVLATGIQKGDNLFHMNKFAIQDKMLEEMPYLEEVLIRRRLPSTITLTVKEWGAVAQLQPNPDWKAPEIQVEEGEEPVEPPKAAQEAWLISVGGKLLEPSGENSGRLLLTGLTALDARAGIQTQVPEEETSRLTGALALLKCLEEREMLPAVSAIHVGTTTIVMEYQGRYDVKLPLNADFEYKLDSLMAAVADQEGKKGPELTGTFDLTQRNYTALFSPQRVK